jgi:hypothetical protein
MHTTIARPPRPRLLGARARQCPRLTPIICMASILLPMPMQRLTVRPRCLRRRLPLRRLAPHQPRRRRTARRCPRPLRHRRLVPRRRPVLLRLLHRHPLHLLLRRLRGLIRAVAVVSFDPWSALMGLSPGMLPVCLLH